MPSPKDTAATMTQLTTIHRMLTVLLLLQVGLAIATPEPAPVCVNCQASNDCLLYLAPSQIEGAGLGVYTTVDLEEGDYIGEPDQFIPVIDKFKTLPFRGQQLFLSWLGYVYPAEPDFFHNATTDSFPTIPDGKYRVNHGLNAASTLKFYKDGERVSAFAPGIASLANSDPEDYNIKKHKSGNDGSPVTFFADEDISAGEELLLNYGKQWHKRLEKKQTSATEYATLQEFEDFLSKKELPTEADKRRKLKQKQRRSLETDDDDELDDSEHVSSSDVDSNDHHVESSTVNKNARDVQDHDQIQDGGGEKQPRLEWLKENGVCIDKLRGVPSNGAFSKTFIQKGELIAPAPLLALKREDLVIYESDESQKALRNVLNFDKIVGQELLLNYCYGHPESPLLLLPYSPIVSFIRDDKDANAEIRWPPETTNDWLDLHPLDVLEMSGQLMMEFVALRDIAPGDEIVIDFGQAWNDAHEQHVKKHGDLKDFRHEIGVPDDFFPEAWKNQRAVYELATPESPLKPGEVSQMGFAHNGKAVCKNCYRVGLPSGFSKHMLEFSDERGITKLYEKLLYDNILKADEWIVFDTLEEEWYAQRYMNRAWRFNMHYVSPWDNNSRTSFLRALGTGGFDTVLDGMGKYFGLNYMSFFFLGFMGVSEADNSFTHTDVYATGEKGFNMIWPTVIVEGSSPELDVISDDANIVLSINYEHDVAVTMGDWVYHKTSPNDYQDGQMRIVVNAYVGQIDETNARMMHYIFDGEDPSPFADQFELPIKDIHWGNGHSLPK